jgi:hypothetical protein
VTREDAYCYSIMSETVCSVRTCIMIMCTDVRTFSTVSEMPNTANARFFNKKIREHDLSQLCKTLTQVSEPSQNCRCQKDDIKQVPYSGFTIIRRHRKKKINQHGVLAARIGVPLV